MSLTKSRSLTKIPIIRWVSTINHLFRAAGGQGWWRGSYPFINYMPTNKGKNQEMISQMWQESRRLDCINTQASSYPTLWSSMTLSTKRESTIYMWMTNTCYPWQNRGWRQQKWQQLTLVVQSSQLCPTLRDPMDCSTPGFPVLHQLPELAHTHVHWVSDVIQPSSVVSFCPQSVPASGSFPMSGLFTSGGQRIAASVLPTNTQGWFPLGWTGWISVQSKGLSRVVSNTTVQKHQFFGTQPSLWSTSHIHTWLLEKP